MTTERKCPLCGGDYGREWNECKACGLPSRLWDRIEQMTKDHRAMEAMRRLRIDCGPLNETEWVASKFEDAYASDPADAILALESVKGEEPTTWHLNHDPLPGR